MLNSQEIIAAITKLIANENFVTLFKAHETSDFKNKLDVNMIKDIVRLLVNQVKNGTIKSAYYPSAEFSFVEGDYSYIFCYKSPLGHQEIIKVHKHGGVEHIVNRTIAGDKALNEMYITPPKAISNREEDNYVKTEISETGSKALYKIFNKASKNYVPKNDGGFIWTRVDAIVAKIKSNTSNNLHKMQDYVIEIIPLDNIKKIDAVTFVRAHDEKKKQKDAQIAATKILKNEAETKLYEIEELTKQLEAKKKSLEDMIKKLDEKLK